VGQFSTGGVGQFYSGANTGRRHETIRRYGQAAGILPPRLGPAKPPTPAKVPTDLKAPTQPVAGGELAGARTSRSSAREHAAFIETELDKGRNAVAIYQDLVEHHGCEGSYDAVKRYARRARPSDPTRFEYYRIVERRVHGDAHVEVDGAYYSAPPRYVGTGVIVHVGRLWLRIIDPRSKQCVREHVTTERGRRRTVEDDLPKQTPPQVHRLVAHVGAAGPSAHAFARAMEAERGALALRSLFGLADLIKRYGREHVDRACALAMSAGTVRLRFLRKALTLNALPSLLDQHDVIESITTYGKHFAVLAQGVPTDD
jgi:hypothetical protein